MEAIVYTSNAGHTKEYAKLLGEIINLPVYEIGEAKGKLDKNADIIYFGWLMAGKVKGYNKALKRYNIKALGAVGMSNSVTQIDDVKKNNNVSEELEIFLLQGGFEIDKLSGIYKTMMNTMRKTVGDKLDNKEELTEEEKDMLDMLKNGRNCVSTENLTEIINWYNAN